MARPITTAMAAQLVAAAKSVALFMQAQFASGTIYLWTGLGTKVWNGQTWSGMGSAGSGPGMLSVQLGGESVAIASAQTIFTLSGINPALLSLVLTEGGHNLTGTMWFACLDGSGNVIGDPLPVDSGLLDQIEIVETVLGPAIKFTYQNRLADLERPRLRYYTDTDQQELSPGDLGFQFVPQVQEWTGTWGTANGNSAVGGT